MSATIKRYELTDPDAEWDKIKHHFPQRTAGTRGRPYHDIRITVNGILGVARSGAP